MPDYLVLHKWALSTRRKDLLKKENNKWPEKV